MAENCILRRARLVRIVGDIQLAADICSLRCHDHQICRRQDFELEIPTLKFFLPGSNGLNGRRVTARHFAYPALRQRKLQSEAFGHWPTYSITFDWRRLEALQLCGSTPSTVRKADRCVTLAVTRSMCQPLTAADCGLCPASQRWSSTKEGRGASVPGSRQCAPRLRRLGAVGP
jgi:hypothetical protein